MAALTRENSQVNTHATSVASRSWSTRRVALCAIFTALALVLSFVELPIFPAAPYLKYDPSGIVALTAGLAFGPGVGAVVAVLPWLVHLFVEPFGAIMALFCAVMTVLPAAAIYRAIPTKGGLATALVVSGIIAIGAAILGNIVITPLYSGMAVGDVVGLIVPVLIPFNVMKVAINAVVAGFAAGPVKTMAANWD